MTDETTVIDPFGNTGEVKRINGHMRFGLNSADPSLTGIQFNRNY